MARYKSLAFVAVVLAAGGIPTTPALARSCESDAYISCELHYPDGRYPQYSSMEDCKEKEVEHRCPPDGPSTPYNYCGYTGDGRYWCYTRVRTR
jgi:hypothetical protein